VWSFWGRTYIKKGPSEASRKLAYLKEGAVLEVLGQEGHLRPAAL